VARILTLVAEAARPGVSLGELDRLAAESIRAQNARPSFPGYHPAWAPVAFPAVLCGYGIPDGYGGHGIGTAMHEDPPVPNAGQAHRGMRLRDGLVLAIEPMFCEGGDDGHRTLPDGWSIATADGSRAAHFEHTVAITADGPVVLTAP
jgi:methionyl aminopeptidase